MNWLTIIGLMAAACTTASFLPQAIKTIKTKKAGDLSLSMYIIITIGVILWIIYGILIKDLPLIVANIITFILTATVLISKIKHDKRLLN